MVDPRAVKLARRVTPGAILWAEDSLFGLRRKLPTAGLKIKLSPPPRARGWMTPGVERWLSYRRATCLERSLVMQRWLAALEEPRDLLIGVGASTTTGVAAGAGTVIAHAWLDGEDPQGHAVMTRVGPADTLAR